MFVLLRTKRMQLRNHVDTQTVKRSQRLKGYAVYMYRIKFRMFEVHENEIALRKLSGGTAHAQLHTLEGTLVIAMFDFIWNKYKQFQK